jgi:hypothetical protein
VPAIGQFFQFHATRMDRYIVACYDSAVGGHFYRHRDNVNIGAQHRRFAVTINLNKDYEGCDMVLPEFGRRTYRAPVGGAMVFSCGALHQVTPVTSGRRYARPTTRACTKRRRSMPSNRICCFRKPPQRPAARADKRQLVITASSANIKSFRGWSPPFNCRPG